MELLISAGMTLNSSAATICSNVFIDKTDLLSKADWTIQHSSFAKMHKIVKFMASHSLA